MCRTTLPREAAFCSSCGARVPKANAALRTRLLECFLDLCDSPQLSQWLEEIDQDHRGRMDEKRDRIWRHTKYLTMPASGFPAQTLAYLRFHKTQADATAACRALGLPMSGSRDALVRRVLRQVHLGECWMPSVEVPTASAVCAVARLYPIAVSGNEANYCAEFEEEAEEIWPGLVHAQYPIAHGITLKIDFHIGLAGREGIGVEFKLPRSNVDLQRAKGQLDQYLAAYAGRRLVVVTLDDGSLTRAQLTLFEREVLERGVVVVRREIDRA